MKSPPHFTCPKCGLAFGPKCVTVEDIYQANPRPMIRKHKAKCGRICAGSAPHFGETADGEVWIFEPSNQPTCHPNNETCDHPKCVKRRAKSS